MTIYPLLMAPFFRSGSETPWGGNMLRDAFMKDAPEQTGESLEVSALEGMESIVNNGVRAATNLRRLAKVWGSALTGTESDEIGLQLSLMDVCEELPAHAHGEDTEAWVILNCDSDSEILYGAQRLRVRPGDIYYIPSGVAHGVGPGVQLLKICSTAGGAEECAPTAEALPGKLYGTTVLCKGGSRTYYVADRHFEMSRLNVAGRMPIADGRMLILMPFAPCRLAWGEEEMELAPFESVVIPGALEDVCLISDDCKVMAYAASDRAGLREVLGYRAENVPGLTE